MKTIRYTFIILLFSTMFSSCSVWNKVFPPKYGCGDNGGRNVGAEKALDESISKKKAKKFKA